MRYLNLQLEINPLDLDILNSETARSAARTIFRHIQAGKVGLKLIRLDLTFMIWSVYLFSTYPDITEKFQIERMTVKCRPLGRGKPEELLAEVNDPSYGPVIAQRALVRKVLGEKAWSQFLGPYEWKKRGGRIGTLSMMTMATKFKLALLSRGHMRKVRGEHSAPVTGNMFGN